MTRPEAGKLGPGELRARTPGATVPQKPEGAPKPAATAKQAGTTRAPATAKPTTGSEPKATATAPRSAALSVAPPRLRAGTRFLARFAYEVIAPDVEWTAKWSATMRGGEEADLIEEYRANLEQLIEATKAEDDFHKHLKNLHAIRRMLPEQLELVDELIKALPVDAYAGQRIESRAEAKKRRNDVHEQVTELEKREDNARKSIGERMTRATDAEAWRKALQHASDEVNLLGVDYPILLDQANDLKAELRTIQRYHAEKHAAAGDGRKRGDHNHG